MTATATKRVTLADRVRSYEQRTSRHGEFAHQVAYVRDPRQFCIASGAIRTGKTYGSAEKFARRLVRDRQRYRGKEPLLYWAIAPTYAQGIAQKIELARLIPRSEIDWSRQGNDMRWSDTKRGGGVLCLKGNVTIEYKSADDEESLVARKVRGVWVTEAARCKWGAISNLNGRVSNYADGWILFDTSPLGHCAFYEQWVRKCREDNAHKSESDAESWRRQVGYHEWTAYDSPFVPRSQVDSARERLPWPWFKRDFLASWDNFKGQIFSEFDEQVHLRAGNPNGIPDKVIIGVDINTSDENPAAFMVMECHTRRKPYRAHIAREYYRYALGLDVDGYARAIAAVAASYRCPVTIVIDHSKVLENRLRMHARNATIKLASKAVHDGIRCVMTAMHDGGQGPLLTVEAPREDAMTGEKQGCPEWINEVKGYAWRSTSHGVITEQPEKVADHLMDATRYACMELWGRNWLVQVGK